MAPKTRPKRRTTTVLVDPEHDQKLMSEDEEDEEDEDYVPNSSEDESDEEESEESEEEEEEDDDSEEEEENNEKEEEIKMKTRVLNLDSKGSKVCAYGVLLKPGVLLETTKGCRCIFSKLGEKPNMAEVHWLFPDKDSFIKGSETSSIPLVLIQTKVKGTVICDATTTGLKDLSYESSLKLIRDGVCKLEQNSLTLGFPEPTEQWTLEKQKELDVFFKTVWPKLKKMEKPQDDSFYGQLFCKWFSVNEDAKDWIVYKFNQWENAVLQMRNMDWPTEVEEVVSL